MGIAHQHIKDSRAKRKVPCAKFGTLADYVPFYFAPRSPMLYAISVGAVRDYRGAQREVAHLVTNAESIQEADLPFAFTDGHADIFVSRFFDELADLRLHVDWDVMRLAYWNDTERDPDRKRRRQAEFLVYRSLPWTLVIQIGVIDKVARSQVTDTLERAAHRPEVLVRPDWYY